MSSPEQSAEPREKLFQNAMNRHWADARGRFLERAKALEGAVRTLLAGEFSNEENENCRRESHKLKGSLGTFGLVRASEIAAELEALFTEIKPGSNYLNLADLVVELREIVEAAPTDRLASASDQPVPDGQRSNVRCLAIISPDDEFIDRVSVHLAARVSVRKFKTIGDIPPEEHPGHVVIDIESRAEYAAMDLFELKNLEAESITVIGLDMTIQERISLVKLGARRLVDRDQPVRAIVEAIAEIVGANPEQEDVVLVVDDDESTVEVLQTVITPHVKELHAISDPGAFWDTLESVQPNLIIVDFEMPEIDGLDLFRITRSEQKYSKVPIVMLTAHDDPELIQRMYAAGADDCVVKPFTSAKLVDRVLRRIHRQGIGTPQNTDEPAGTVVAATVELPVEDSHPPTFEYTHDITIVDDDDIVGGLLNESLSTQSYSVAWLKDGEEAISELCGENPRIRPRLLLLDVDMPGRNGLEVLRQLVVDGVVLQTHVIMLTGRSTESETLEALRIGAADHLAKPFSMPVLIEKVRGVVRHQE